MSVTLHTTMGDVKLELDCARVPRACENFLALAASHVYDNTLFHRIVPGHAVQGGDPTGTGRRSRSAWGRRVADEIISGLDFSAPGVVAFANAGEPSVTGVGSQFFITSAPCPHLNGTCTIFGRVIFGLDTVKSLSAIETDPDTLRPLKDVLLERITIHANPIAVGD
jgi:peptidyl-prolyl cis-trans isomerase-like 3